MEEWLSVTLKTPPVSQEAVSFLLFDLGAEAIWENQPDPDGNLVLTASFPKEDAMRLMSALPNSLTVIAKSFELPVKAFSLTLELLPVLDYAESWKAEQKPIQVSPTLILAPTFWQGDLKEYFGLKDNTPSVLRIDPGAAFGSGRHPTTFLCLKILANLADDGLKPSKILDIGAGSGILSLAAGILFPEAEIAGIDNDPDTIPVALNNREQNNLKASINFSDTPLSQLAPGFSLILANLTLNPLLNLASDITNIANPDSILILSGLIEEQTKEVYEAFRKEGWTWSRHLGQGEWSALSFELGNTPLENVSPPDRILAQEPSLETSVKNEDY